VILGGKEYQFEWHGQQQSAMRKLDRITLRYEAGLESRERRRAKVREST